MINPLEMTIVD